MVVLADPSMSKERDELFANAILSPESIYKVHNHLLQLPQLLVDNYVNNLLSDVRSYHNNFTASLSGRLSRSIAMEGFIAHDLTPALVP